MGYCTGGGAEDRFLYRSGRAQRPHDYTCTTCLLLWWQVFALLCIVIHVPQLVAKTFHFILSHYCFLFAILRITEVKIGDNEFAKSLLSARLLLFIQMDSFTSLARNGIQTL